MSRIAYHLKEGFRGVIRHLAMSLSSASAVMLTLILVAVFLVFNACLQQVATHLEQSIKVVAKIDPAYDNVINVDELTQEISSIPGVATVTYSTKDQELQSFIDSFPDQNGDVFNNYAGDQNPLDAALNVSITSGADWQSLINKIQTLPGIVKVLNGGAETVAFIDNLGSIRHYAFAVVVVLGLLAVFLIANTIRITIFSRNREISIMRTVGASNNFIRAPFLFEGMMIGAMGSIIPILIVIIGYNYLYKATNGIILTNMFRLPTVMPLVQNISLAIFGIGVGVGLIGSFISVTRHLRWSR